MHDSENARSAKTVKNMSCGEGEIEREKNGNRICISPRKIKAKSVFKTTTGWCWNYWSLEPRQVCPRRGQDRYLLLKRLAALPGGLFFTSPATTDPLEGIRILLWLGHKLMTTKPKHKKHKHIFSHTKKEEFLCTFYLFFSILLDIL